MKKTGREMIWENRNGGKPARCSNCGGEGVYRVIYEDVYSKLEVTLCEGCEKLGYGQLKLQSQFDWPVKA